MKKRYLLALVATLALPAVATAATTDTATVAQPGPALVGAPVTITSTTTCTVACQMTWRRPDIGLTRYGGVIIGYGQTVTYTFTTPGVYPIRLDLSERCAGSGGRLTCHSYATVYVDVS